MSVIHKENIIVLGTTHHNTLGIIRALGESPQHYCCDLVLYGEHESYLEDSIYVSRAYFVDSVEDITEALLSMATQVKQIILAVTDEAVYQLDKNADTLSPHFHFFGTKEIGSLTRCMDKQVQDDLAKSVGMHVPANYKPDQIVYPCLLKPLASISGGKRVLICENKEDYKKYEAQYSTTVFQIQQFLKKEYEIVLVCLAVNNDVYIPAYVLKHRDFMGGTTYSTVHPIGELDTGLINKAKELINNIGYEGLLGIEFIFSEGRYWFIEANLRSDATTYSVAVAGVNLPLAYIMAKQGLDIKYIINAPIHIINSIVEFRDFEFVLRRQLGLMEWLRQRNHCECRYFYSHNDKKPYKYNMRQMRKRIMKMLCNKVISCLRIWK